MSKAEKIVAQMVDAIYDYPLSWTYTLSMTAFQPMLKEFLPVFTQVFLLLCIHLITILVDWLRKRLDIEKSDESHKKSMEILEDLESKIKTRKERKKAKEESKK